MREHRRGNAPDLAFQHDMGPAARGAVGADNGLAIRVGFEHHGKGRARWLLEQGFGMVVGMILFRHATQGDRAIRRGEGDAFRPDLEGGGIARFVTRA